MEKQLYALDARHIHAVWWPDQVYLAQNHQVTPRIAASVGIARPA
jgi:hypothetical protein